MLYSSIYTLAIILVCAVYKTSSMEFEGTFDPAIHALEDLVSYVDKLRTVVKGLAQQTMSQQLFVEERIRSNGHSGLLQTRSYNHGTHSYFDTTHIAKGAASMHDHSNSHDILGLGEVVAVINGVEFRTRHNDYHMVQQDKNSSEYNAVVPIQYPFVPPEVLNKTTVEEQILEMREWIKAFAEQNHTVRDYREYFRPVLCFMEGAWTLDPDLQEPFFSRRHRLTALSWAELQQQIRYTSYTGGKHIKENFSFLPSTIISVNETTGEPLYAQWNYRLLCHPYSGDIPTKYFRLQDDFSYRQATRRPLSRVRLSRAARFSLSEYKTPRFTEYTLLDKIFYEIAGRDNNPDQLNEAPLGQTLYDSAYNNATLLNTGFFHRMYRTGARSASGTLRANRGFSDRFLYVAETTQPRVAPMNFRRCLSRRCEELPARFTFAIPIEVVYLTPLLTWNPYNLPIWDDFFVPTKGGRKGLYTHRLALNGTSEYRNFYLTPPGLFKGLSPDENDPADTAKIGVGVLDRKGVIRRTVASGTRIVLPPIDGVGRVRLRYPIFPLHVEGSTIWKELEVVKKKMKHAKGTEVKLPGLYFLNMYPTVNSGLHTHEFYLSKDDYKAVMAGELVSVTTSLENGHSHQLDLIYDQAHKRIIYKTCDGNHRCWDGHPRPLFIIYDPEEYCQDKEEEDED